MITLVYIVMAQINSGNYKEEVDPKSYWFVSIICFKRSTHWPIFETGFGGIANS